MRIETLKLMSNPGLLSDRRGSLSAVASWTGAVGSVVIGYSDGLVKPENAYGEEFGVSRLGKPPRSG